MLGILEHLGQKREPLLLVRLQNRIRARCTSIIRLACDQKVLEPRQEPADLVGHQPQSRSTTALSALLLISFAIPPICNGSYPNY